MQISEGHGGWVLLHDVGIDGNVYLRLGERHGRLRVLELYVETSEGVEAKQLGALPLREIEVIEQGDPVFAGRLNTVGPDLSRLASHFGTGFGRQATHWVAQSMRAQIAGSDVEQADRGRDRRPQERPPRVPLNAPIRIDEQFLQRVAQAYRYAVEDGLAPAPTLAAEAGVTARAVHKWVAIARQRGVMPPGQQGRVG